MLLGTSATLSACDLPNVTFNGAGGNSGGSSTTTTGGTGGVPTTTTPMHAGGGGGTGPGSGGAMGGAGGGLGGMGGATSTTTSTTTTTTTTATTSGGGVVLQCNLPNVSDCEPGQVCCLDKTEPYMDMCAEPGNCVPASDWTQASCANDSHCTVGVKNKCCLNFSYNAITMNTEFYTYCDTECTPDKSETIACTDDNDCLVGTCQKVLGDPYTEYLFCWP